MKKGLHKISGLINTLLTIAVVVILPIVIFTLITSKTNKVWGIQSFIVLSGSMEPKIPTGSVIYTKTEAGYLKGDIIAFIQGGITITHRIVGYSSGEFITKGDANNITDNNSVPKNKIVGKEVFLIPFLGYFIRFLATLQGFILLVMFPVYVFVIAESWNIIKEFKKSRDLAYFRKMFVRYHE